MVENPVVPTLATPIGSPAQDRAIRVLTALVEDLTVERDEEGLLASTLDHAVGALDLAGGATFLVDSEQALKPSATCGLPGALMATAMELAHTAVQQGETLFRALSETNWLAATPLMTAQRRLGALILYDSGAGHPAPDAELLKVLGKQIGTGLENVRLYAELRATSARTETLSRVTAAITSSMDLKLVVPAFARELRSMIKFERVAFAFVNDSGDYIEVAAYPEDSTWGIGNVIPVVGSGPGSVLLNSRPVIQHDLLRSHRFIEDMRLLEEGLRSYLLLPIHSHNHNIGVLAVGSREAGAYSEQTLVTMQPLANAIALALENVRLFQRTRELSITDEVTPLYNFRYFHQILDRELKLVDRYHS
ncbi:MAG: GAF domain-containing protein, partial [Vicinamibacteria bacterium]|nr:GAF domain-containing protein [Vicinamibacteria bacterium]